MILIYHFLVVCGAIAIGRAAYIFVYMLYDEIRTKYLRWRRYREREKAEKLRAKEDLGLDNLVVVWDDGNDFYHIGIDAGGDCAYGFKNADRIPFAYKIPFNEFTPKKAKELEL